MVDRSCKFKAFIGMKCKVAKLYPAELAFFTLVLNSSKQIINLSSLCEY